MMNSSPRFSEMMSDAWEGLQSSEAHSRSPFCSSHSSLAPGPTLRRHSTVPMLVMMRLNVGVDPTG